ncbi:hypothetical protein Sinac_5156 [Singulisphaera acidiphila DSM 18658]|uniref:Uncharacterized protein n=1 Tax=Singulisphaera acidiphila (strain ATCC BAA-1392 / DSM 18658 / VKM B-2454 / MOB10) TaxID=886293 RepID=L0DKE4_SINAD|nr:hypothetical protein Sinac_5156 [Singulisphaera acidiphila DSM 18658]
MNIAFDLKERLPKSPPAPLAPAQEPLARRVTRLSR